jgi:hypothetical protein
MTEGSDRDPEDREVRREIPSKRDQDIDAAFVVIAFVLATIIAFQLLFG